MERREPRMTATELAAVVVTICSVAAVMLLAFGLVAIRRTLAELRGGGGQLRTETAPVVAEMSETVRAANVELERVDNLLGTAESIGGTVDSASGLAYLAFSNPVIKGLAVASGTGRAAPVPPSPAGGLTDVLRRLFWLFLGIGVGLGSSVWVTRRVKQAARRATRRSACRTTSPAPCVASATTCASRCQRAARPMLRARGGAPRRAAPPRRLTHPTASGPRRTHR